MLGTGARDVTVLPVCAPAAGADASGLFLPRAGTRGSTFLRGGALAGPSPSATYAESGWPFISELNSLAGNQPCAQCPHAVVPPSPYCSCVLLHMHKQLLPQCCTSLLEALHARMQVHITPCLIAKKI